MSVIVPAQPSQGQRADEYLAALAGPESQRFLVDLAQAGEAAGVGDLTSEAVYGRQVVADATDWLAQLARTSPPPEYLVSRRHLIAGVYLIRRGAAEIAQGCTDHDRALRLDGARYLRRGAAELSRSSATMPDRGAAQGESPVL